MTVIDRDTSQDFDNDFLSLCQTCPDETEVTQ